MWLELDALNMEVDGNTACLLFFLSGGWCLRCTEAAAFTLQDRTMPRQGLFSISPEQCATFLEHNQLFMSILTQESYSAFTFRFLLLVQCNRKLSISVSVCSLDNVICVDCELPLLCPVCEFSSDLTVTGHTWMCGSEWKCVSEEISNTMLQESGISLTS